MHLINRRSNIANCPLPASTWSCSTARQLQTGVSVAARAAAKMHRSLMAGNKLCYARDVENRQRQHRHKMTTMRPTSRSNSRANLDNNRPPRQLHLEMGLKKRQLENEQYDRIERDNRLLMEKMYHIMKVKGSGEGERSTIEFAPGVRLNSHQGPMVDCFLSDRSMYPGKAVKLDSLNRDSRRRQYERVMEENMSILRRIQLRKPNYERSAWARDREQTEEYLRMIRNDRTSGFLPPGASSLEPTFSTYKSSSPSRGGSRSRQGGGGLGGGSGGSGKLPPLEPHQQQLSYALDDALDDGDPLPDTTGAMAE